MLNSLALSLHWLVISNVLSFIILIACGYIQEKAVHFEEHPLPNLALSILGGAAALAFLVLTFAIPFVSLWKALVDIGVL